MMLFGHGYTVRPKAELLERSNKMYYLVKRKDEYLYAITYYGTRAEAVWTDDKNEAMRHFRDDAIERAVEYGGVAEPLITRVRRLKNGN